MFLGDAASSEWLQSVLAAAGCPVEDLQARITAALRDNGHLKPLEVEPDMPWPVFRDMYIARLGTRYGESDHPGNVRRVLDRFTRYADLANRRLNEVVSYDLENYVARRRRDEWRKRALTNRTLNNEIDILNAVFAFAGPREPRGPGRKRLGLLTSPPYCELLPIESPNPVVLTLEQIQRFIDATEHATTPRLEGCTPQQFWLAALVLTGITALRRKALLRIPRPDDYTLHELRELVLPAKLNKTRAEMRITLGRSDEVINLLASLPSKPGEPLLPWKDREGKPMGLGYFNNVMADFQRRAGIPDGARIKTKFLRSTAGTEVGDRLGDTIAKKKLGHAPGSRTFDIHYKGRRPTETDRDASDLMAGLLFKAMPDAARALISPPTADASSPPSADGEGR